MVGGYITIRALRTRIRLSVNWKRQLYIHPQYLNDNADILERDRDNESCGTIDRDPTINEERNGIFVFCFLAGTSQREFHHGSPSRSAVMIVVEEAKTSRTPRDSDSTSSSVDTSSTSVNIGSRMEWRWQDKKNLLIQPKAYRRIGILRVWLCMDEKKWEKIMLPRNDWKIF